MPTSGGGCTLLCFSVIFQTTTLFKAEEKMTIFTFLVAKVFDKTFHSEGRLFILVCLFSDELYLVVNMRFYKKNKVFVSKIFIYY